MKVGCSCYVITSSRVSFPRTPAISVAQTCSAEVINTMPLKNPAAESLPVVKYTGLRPIAKGRQTRSDPHCWLARSLPLPQDFPEMADDPFGGGKEHWLQWIDGIGRVITGGASKLWEQETREKGAAAACWPYLQIV